MDSARDLNLGGNPMTEVADLYGVNPILPTPFQDDGALDLASLERLIDFQATVGADGVAILGFLGEAHKLAEAERRPSWRRWLRAPPAG